MTITVILVLLNVALDRILALYELLHALESVVLWIDVSFPDPMNVSRKIKSCPFTLHRTREKGIHLRILLVVIFQDVFYPGLDRLLHFFRSVFIILDILPVSDCKCVYQGIQGQGRAEEGIVISFLAGIVANELNPIIRISLLLGLSEDIVLAHPLHHGTQSLVNFRQRIDFVFVSF